ncbi:14360_t:CDS:2, partial [Gigaspora margarita]
MQSSSTINEDYRHESLVDYSTGSNNNSKNSDNNTMQSSSIINKDYRHESFANYGTGSNNNGKNSNNYSNNNNYNSIVSSSVQQKKRTLPLPSSSQVLSSFSVFRKAEKEESVQEETEQVDTYIPKEQSLTNISSTANVSRRTNSDDTSKQIEINSDNISNNTSNPDSKSLEDKTVDEFMISTYKEKVSKEIIQRIRKKKLQEQELSSISVEGLYSKKPEETKVSHNYIVAQDFIQEVSSGFTDKEIIEVIDEVELAYLFLKLNRQKEISCHYSYGKRFEMGVQELM